MYVTRPLSMYKNSPEAVAEPPPQGPNSGYLVLQDDESTGTTCFGLCKNRLITDLPFPQNKRLTIEHNTGEHSTLYPLFLIPVVNEPLSCNQYYVIMNEGKHKGEAYASSTDEDRQTCCLCINYIKDQKTRLLDPTNVYQKFEFSLSRACCGYTVFDVKSVAPDGYPPAFLRRKGWRLWASDPKHFSLEQANGLNTSLRNRLPDFEFSSSQECSEAVVVGKWYTPFMFVREATPKEQLKRSMFYEVRLEQKWERMYYCENQPAGEGNVLVSYTVVVPTQRVMVEGKEVTEFQNNEADGMLWFRTQNYNEEGPRIALSALVVERMKWEQQSFGWSDHGNQMVVTISKAEKYQGNGSWRLFGAYMLVERYVFKRMGGSIALSFDFYHTHLLKIKWDD